MSARPWRAAAYWPGSYRRVYTGYTSAKTLAGLDRFVAEHSAAGCVVDVWEVLPLPPPLVILDDPCMTEVTDGTPAAGSPAG